MPWSPWSKISLSHATSYVILLRFISLGMVLQDISHVARFLGELKIALTGSRNPLQNDYPKLRSLILKLGFSLLFLL